MADNMKNNPGGGNPGAANRGNPGGAGGQGGQGNTMDQVRDTAQSMADKAGEYAHQAREKAGEFASQARDWAGQAGDRVQQWAGEAYDVAADNLGDFGRELTGLVRRHPIPAILVGFGVGLLLGRAARMV